MSEAHATRRLQSGSLRRSVARRLALMLLLALLCLSLGVLVLSRQANDMLVRQQVDDAAGFFEARTAEMEMTWLTQAETFRSQLDLARVLDEPDLALLRAKLTSYSSSLGGLGTFTQVLLLDEKNQLLHRYRTGEQTDAGVPQPLLDGERAQAAWAYSEQDRRLYRVFSQPVYVQGGRGKLLLYLPLDNGLLARLVYPNTRIRLMWQGTEVASSAELEPLSANTWSAWGRVAHVSALSEVAWASRDAAASAAGSPQAGPVLSLERRVLMTLSTVDLLLIVLACGALIALLGWLALGRWLALQSRRLGGLGQTLASFGQRHEITRDEMQSLRSLSVEGDEVAQLSDGVQVMVRDIEAALAKEQQARLALQELNATLESRVSQRTTELSDALRTLRSAQENIVRSEKLAALGALVAGVAHELNTPIGNSVMMASYLQDKALEIRALVDAGGLRKPDLMQFASDVASGADLLARNLERAAGLLTSFKQVSADQASEQRRTFDLKSALQEIVRTLSPMLRGTPHRFELEVPEGINMHSYPGPLAQVITNLASNSLVHAFAPDRAGVMRITVQAAGQHEIRLVFEDDGRGIPPDHLEHVFDPFFTTRLGQGGSGLGLHITHNVCRRVLGGSISVSNSPQGGAVFELVLPLRAPLQASMPDLRLAPTA